MFEWIKGLFRKNQPIKKEIGGIKLPGGIVIGPMYFSKNGKQSSVMMGPPIMSFDYGVTNVLNRLNQTVLPPDEFQAEFNSLLENLIADILVYFQNRLKLIVKKSSVGQMNSIDSCVAEYKKYSIEIGKLCDLDFLTQLDRVRGRKHHSDRRYDADYTIGGVEYNTIDKLRELAERVRREIKNFDNELSKTHKDYDVKIETTPTSTSIEFRAVGHAFDLTRGGKVVPKKPKPPQA